jgi:hypothetical protein
MELTDSKNDIQAFVSSFVSQHDLCKKKEEQGGHG